MRRLVAATEGFLIADSAFALGLPPVAYGLVPDSWKTIPEFTLEVWGNATINLTDLVLYGAMAHPYAIDDLAADGVDFTDDQLEFDSHSLLTGDGPLRLRNRIALVYADKVFTADHTTGLFTALGHGLQQSDGPLQTTNTGGALPAGLTALTDYWVIVVDADHFKLAASLDDADAGVAVVFTTNGTGTQKLVDTPDTERDQDDLPAGLSSTTDYYVTKIDGDHITLATSRDNALLGTPVDFTDNGTGVVYLVDTADTQRVHWQTHDDLLGLAGDGAVPLTLQVGYSKRIPNNPRIFAYALVGTLSTSDPEWVSASLYPLVEE